MPHFTKPSPNLRTDGPVIEIRLAVASKYEQTLIQNHQAVPEPVSVRALIDTGSPITVIREGIAERLNIDPAGVEWLTTALSSYTQCPVYLVRLLFSHEDAGDAIEVTAAAVPLPYQNVECLIGRDVLQHAVLTYIGFKNTFTLSL
ncbi:MAG TPA: aspartyl protease family protein [Chloroflexia bacterium]|jgi:predicted aspartyl protease